MERKVKLLLLEGIPGSGKTSITQWLSKSLACKGIPTVCYTEGSSNPIDLAYHAYLTKAEWNDLVQKHTDYRDWLQRAVPGDTYYLAPYQDPVVTPNEALSAYLKAREFCYSDHPVVSFREFRRVFLRRFTDFSKKAFGQEPVILMESVLLQHQIHDVHRLYPYVSREELLQYLYDLADALGPLHPVLYYIHQADVETALQKTAEIRKKPRWGLSETIAYYKDRQGLEVEALPRLPIGTRRIAEPYGAWEAIQDAILQHAIDALGISKAIEKRP